MASSPKFKVFTRKGEYVASCKDPLHAAAILRVLGWGSIRLGHRASETLFSHNEIAPLPSLGEIERTIRTACAFVENKQGEGASC